MQERFVTASSSQWASVFEAAKVPLSPIHDIAEAMADEQSGARNLIWNMGKALRMIANPLQHMSRTPARPAAAPPELGQDTRDVLLNGLGLSLQDLDTLSREGVIALQEPAES